MVASVTGEDHTAAKGLGLSWSEDLLLTKGASGS